LAPVFTLLLLHFRFKCVLLASFSFQAEEKKKNVEKGGSLPSSSCSAFSLLPSHFCPPIFALMFHVLSLSIFFSSRRKEKKHKEKKNHRGKKNQRREGAYLQAPILPSHVWLLLLPSCFCLPAFALLFQMFFPSIFFFSNRRKKKNTKKKKL